MPNKIFVTISSLENTNGKNRSANESSAGERGASESLDTESFYFYLLL